MYQRTLKVSVHDIHDETTFKKYKSKSTYFIDIYLNKKQSIIHLKYYQF